MCPKTDLSRQRSIVDDFMQEDYAKSSACDCAEIMSEIHIDTRANRTDILLHADNFELNEMQIKLKNFSVCI